MIPDPLITVNSWDPVEEVVDVDIQLHNPTWATGYDVRLIIFTDDDGHILLNADNWTPLWDIPGGQIANPFKAYAKHEINRAFTGLMWLQENFQIRCPNSNFDIQFAVDASYPENCEEPYEITEFVQGRLYDTTGSSTNIEVVVRDWQDDVNAVQIYCPEITSMPFVDFSQINTDTWRTEIINNAGASEGEYQGFIIGKSSNSGTLVLYDQVSITVKHQTVCIPDNPGIIHTIHTLDYCQDVAVNGNYAYVADYDHGMKVVDISDMSNLEVVARFKTEKAYEIDVEGDVACIADGRGELKIIDISDPLNPELFSHVNVCDFARNVAIRGEYVYVVGDEFAIVNIIQPSNPVIEGVITTDNIEGVAVDGDFAFLVSDDGFFIVDIGNPNMPELISSLGSATHGRDVVIKENYAYVVGNYGYVIDITDLHNPIIASSIPVNNGFEIQIVSNTAYVADWYYGVTAIDISNPLNPQTLGSLDSECAEGIAIKDDYLLLADRDDGLKSIDIRNPQSMSYIDEIRTYGIYGAIVDNDLMYVAINYCALDRDGELRIMDLSIPADPVLLGNLHIVRGVITLDVNNDYALLGAWGSEFLYRPAFWYIVDISNPYVPMQMCSNMGCGYDMFSVQLDSQYAYIGESGVSINNIDDPANPFQAGGFMVTGDPLDVVVKDGFMFIAMGENGMQIADISIPGTARVVSDVSTEDANGVDVSGVYAYVADGINGFKVIDVSDPFNPELVSNLPIDGTVVKVNVEGDFAYLAANSGMIVIDISDPLMPYIFSSLETDVEIMDISIDFDHAVLVAGSYGLYIIQLCD